MAGTLYVKECTRAKVPSGIIKAYDLDVKIASADETFKKQFPLAKFPSYLGEKGFKLTETVAISIYLLKKADANSPLLGKSDEDFAQILKWASWGNSELMPAVTDSFYGIVGKAPYNKKITDTGKATMKQLIQIMEERLYSFTYLVGERLTLADLLVAQFFFRPFGTILGPEERSEFPNVVKWFKTVIATKVLKEEFKDFEFAAKTLEYTPPKKEKKPAQAPAAKKEKAAEKPAEQAPAQAPKPKHPLEALGRPKAPLDEWKRIYSNEETREVAIPWFWKNMYDPEEWSLWKVDYKYNDELTLTFMSNNLVGGFFTRLSASIKYIFGCMVVYGENNNNGITGFFLVRGQDHVPAFDVAPDWESYEFTKLDGSDEKTQKFVNNMLAWDEPVEVNGELKEIADGKVCK